MVRVHCGGAVSNPWLAWRRGEDVALLSRRVHSAYETFLRSPTLDHASTLTAVRPVVLQSWLRSRDRGVDPDSSGAGAVLADDELRDLREHHPLAAVVPVVRRLLVEDANDTGLLVAITDAQGRMLWVEGEQGLRRRAAPMRFVEGADWSEAAAGTNAPGTALALDHSVQIFGAEHFSRTVQPWSCSAAPVHDPRTGELLGVIDVTGGDRVAAPEILTLVRATAAAAESELLLLAMNGRLPATTPRRLTVLGRDRPRLHTAAGSAALSLRHAEILLLLAERPEGLRAEELAVELAERDLDTVTVRAEVSRLRRVVGPELLGSRPYRLTAPLCTEVAQVRDLLASGHRAAAVRVPRTRTSQLPRSRCGGRAGGAAGRGPQRAAARAHRCRPPDGMAGHPAGARRHRAVAGTAGGTATWLTAPRPRGRAAGPGGQWRGGAAAPAWNGACNGYATSPLLVLSVTARACRGRGLPTRQAWGTLRL